MSSFEPIEINPKRPRLSWLVIVIALGAVAYLGLWAYRELRPRSARWVNFQAYRQDPSEYEDIILRPGMRCDDSVFAFPTTGVIFGFWNQSYRPGHIHTGLDIFPGTEPGVTPIYAAYDGYLTRLVDWKSTVIIRIPNDPLEPTRQIWTYYTHMASEDGDTIYISDEFPPGTNEVFVEAGTFLGYQGTWSGNPDNPTGLHLHFSVVRDDDGRFMNETELDNTYDPSPYFNLPVNQAVNPDEFALCAGEVTYDDWDLVNGDE